jgi:transcriptional regulator with XRE-family HTH domain
MAMRYKHLWKKIARIRRQLGLDQSEFAKKLSTPENSIKRTAVARWEAKDERNRSNPSAEQILAIANLTGNPKHYLAWLVHDSVSADADIHIAYTDDGRIEEFTDWDIPDEVVEEMRRDQELHAALYDEKVAAPPRGVLAQAMSDPSAIEALRIQLEADWNDQRPSSGLEAVADLVAQKQVEQARLESEKFAKKARHFREAVKYFCNQQDFEDRFDSEVKLGSLTLRADYFDGRSLIEFVTHRSSQEGTHRRLKEKVGEMLLFEKALKKNPKKLLVLVTDDPTPNANPSLQSDIHSFGTIGIRLLVTVPEKAEAVSRSLLEFIRADPADVNSPDLIPFVIGPSEH